MALAPCEVASQTPAPTEGCYTLDQEFRDACIITDTPDQVHAIDAALGSIATALESTKTNYHVLSARRKLLAAPINVAEEISGAVSYITQEFSNIMIQYNTWMKEHGTDVTVTLEIAGRADALATDIASQTQACLTMVQRDITEPTQQMETVGSVY